MTDPNLVRLAREYLELIDAMASGQYSTADLKRLDADRQWTHNELIRLTGLAPTADMAGYCRRLLHITRGLGQ